MKLIVINCLREDKDKALQLMESNGLSWIYFVDSHDYMTGQKNDLVDAWFSAEKEFSESALLFSLTDEVKANQIIDAAEIFNRDSNENNYPLNAFVVPIDKWAGSFLGNDINHTK